MTTRLVALLLMVAFAGETKVQAATVVVSAVLDRPYVFPGPADRHPTYYTQYLTPAFALSPGDTLDATLTFPGGAPLKLGFLPADVQFTVFGGSGGTSTTYRSTATLSFINPIGAVNQITGPQTSVFDRNPAVDFTGVRQRHAGTLMFDGVHVVMHLDSALFPDGSAGPAEPDRFSAFQISFTNDVPEPATWMMLITGFALTAAMIRKRPGRSLRRAVLFPTP